MGPRWESLPPGIKAVAATGVLLLLWLIPDVFRALARAGANPIGLLVLVVVVGAVALMILGLVTRNRFAYGLWMIGSGSNIMRGLESHSMAGLVTVAVGGAIAYGLWSGREAFVGSRST